jgi:hydroxyacid-oxoacid transhydrogenase
VLAAQLTRLMQATGIPNGVAGVGYGEADLPALVAGTMVQTRLVDNAPRKIDAADLEALFRGALHCW